MNRQIRASMTVEAAIVLPLFLIFFINFSGVLELLRFQSNLSMALWETGSKLTSYGALMTEDFKSFGRAGRAGADEEARRVASDAEGSRLETDEASGTGIELGDMLLSYSYVRGKIISYMGADYIKAAPIRGGTLGLQFLGSEILSGDNVDIRVSFQSRPIVSQKGIIDFWYTNRFYGHLWTGYSGHGGTGATDNNEQIVFITEDSEVYHVSSECTHLRLSVNSAASADISMLRNNDGKRYKACEKCAAGLVSDKCYYAPSGDKYHYSANCSGLKRSYSAIPITEAQIDHRPCSRCGE